VKPPPSGPADWTQRYEALRGHALGEGRLGFRPLGLAVLRHRGVIGWMDVESRVLDPAAVETPRRSGDDAAALEPGSIHSELVALLAGTALLVAAGGRR